VLLHLGFFRRFMERGEWAKVIWIAVSLPEVVSRLPELVTLKSRNCENRKQKS